MMLLFVLWMGLVNADTEVVLLECDNSSVTPSLRIEVVEVTDQKLGRTSMEARIFEGSSKKFSYQYLVALDPSGKEFISRDSNGFVKFQMKKTNWSGRFVDVVYMDSKGKTHSPGYTTYCDRNW